MAKSDLKDLQDQGLITVYLALVFMMLMSCCFVMIEGVREYMTGAICEDALEGAAQNVLANYDKPLFDRYHLFFLDPREKKLIRQDGLDYFSRYDSKSSGFFGFQCESLSVTFMDSSTDRDGSILKHEIREWMKYREHPGDKGKIQDMFRVYREIENRKEEYISELRNVPDYDFSGESRRRREEDGDGGSGEGDDDRYSEEQDKVSPEAILWKSVKETLNMYKYSDLLYSCAGSGRELSALKADLSGLPSGGRQAFASGRGKDKVPSCSFEDVHEIAGMFPDEEPLKPDEALFSDEKYIGDYIGEHFHFFQEEAFEGTARELAKGESEQERGDTRTALHYEKEYMLNGDSSDIENLKKTVHRIFLHRFMVNYDYARKNGSLWNRAGEIAKAAAGQDGLSENPEAGRLLLVGAAAYAQSITDLKILLAGKPVPLVPADETWQVSFEGFSHIFKEGESSCGPDRGVSYMDYLDYYLMSEKMRPVRCMKMMDLMQMNVRLSESDFQMSESLFSFRWKAVFRSARWFPEIPGFGLISDTFMKMSMVKTNSY